VRDLTLQDFPFLSSLAASESARDRRIWLRVASDHFVAAEPDDPDAIEIFAEFMASKLDAADPQTRLDIARKLSTSGRTPLRLLARLEATGPEVSDLVLEHAIAYSDRELIQAVATGPREAIAVAKRKALGSTLAALLASHDEIAVPIALALNSFAQLESATLIRLLRRARSAAEHDSDLRLAEALLQRRPIQPEHALLFLFARPDQRDEILLAAQRMQLGRPPRSFPPAKPGVLDDLEMAAIARQPDRFVALLAEALDCEPSLAQAIVNDASGEPLVVALASLGAANEVLVRVLIANDLQSGASYQRIRALARLNNALDRGAATLVVAALRDGGVMRRRHQKLADGRHPPDGPRAVSTRSAAARGDATARMRAK
jgi:hypothetical protein